ncbi:MAG TPA: methyltransferase domain-containing protein [Acidimicrobiales bacterium]|nr:methyltransferase domain-containing protein [Acidimicrobiales bacterium]
MADQRPLGPRPLGPFVDRARDQSPGDWDATTYDKVSDPMTRWGAAVLDRLPLEATDTVLDAGCGSGRVTELLLGRVPEGHVVALDAAPSMVAEAHRRLDRYGPRCTVVDADLLDLEPATLAGYAPVDAVLSTATFHWVLDHDRLFANLAAVMAPGAVLEAQCGAAGNIEGLMVAVRRAGSERAGTWLYATPEDTRRRLHAAGFVDVQVWTHPEPTPLEPGEPLETYLATVCLRTHVADMERAERQAFLRAVADAMPEPVIDYVRLNISARRPAP